MTAGIRRVQATNYRCLRDVDVELDQFQVLVGANGSGKSALFDAILFVSDLLVVGVDAALGRRTSDMRDLIWGRPDRDLAFKLAFELDIPKDMRELIPKAYQRFSVSLAVEEADGELCATLNGCLKRPLDEEHMATDGDFAPGLWKTEMKSGSATPFMQLDGYENPQVSRFVQGTFQRVRELSLDNQHLRQAAPPPRFDRPAPDHALPWLLLGLKRFPDRYSAWLQHIRTAIADIRDVRVKTRDDDRHSYFVAIYGSGLEVPSWGLSDGTLRLLALTIIAYLPEEGRTYLIEEPENGVHPLALEAVYRSLSCAYEAQVLVATHSPVFLACMEPKELLCFSKHDGQTRIIRGDKHPHLKHWRSAADVDLLFAAEVLG